MDGIFWSNGKKKSDSPRLRVSKAQLKKKKITISQKTYVVSSFRLKIYDFVDISIVTVLKGRHDFYVMIKKNKQKLSYTDNCKLCSSGATILLKMRPQIIKYELTCVPRKNTIDKGGGAKQNFVWNKHTRYRSISYRFRCRWIFKYFIE